MPKGAHHHLHLTAAAPIDFLIELSYEPYVYFNERDNIFRVQKDGKIEECGFLNCNELRNYHASADDFDNFLKDKILLGKKDIESQESQQIWDIFQYRFLMTNDLYNYAPFFERIVTKIFEEAIAEHIYIVELRHIVGFVFDDQRNSIEVRKELEIFDRCVQKIRKSCPIFECKIIICGLKIIGKDHVQKQIDDTHEGMHIEDYKYLIAGYDMVNEEDTTPPIQEFVEQIMKAQDKEEEFPCVFHCGETCERTNTNLYDALLLGTNRIGHGFAIANHPTLIDYCIQEKICLEVCPISNFILAYTLDLRNHPIRFLLNHGLQVSLNADDPGFYNYSGVTLDFAFAFLAWELSVADLKQLAINAITFASVSEEVKEVHLAKFHEDWKVFIETFLAKN